MNDKQDRILSELYDMMTQAHKQVTSSKTNHDRAVAHGRFMAFCEVQDMIREIMEDNE